MRPLAPARSGQRTPRSSSRPSVTSSPPPSRSPSRQTGRRPARAARTPMAAVSTEAPTPPDPPTTPMMCAVFMPPESPRPQPAIPNSRRPVDCVTNHPGVVDCQISRRRQIAGRIGTAPDGGHRGPSTLQTPGGGVGAPAHSTPRGNVHNQMMSLLGGRLQTARKPRRWRSPQEDGTPRAGCHLTARLASYQA